MTFFAKPILLTSILAALAGTSAVAQTAAPAAAAAAPASTLSYNVGVVTDYRYRGISQSRLQPAVQGGVDFAHSSGAYVGAWASTIKWVKDAGGDSDVELDIYGGYKGSAGAVSYDVGVLTYVYPSNALSTSANTTEIYAAGTVGPATLKYSHSLTNTFGFPNSKNSGYLDLSATFDLAWFLISDINALLVLATVFILIPIIQSLWRKTLATVWQLLPLLSELTLIKTATTHQQVNSPAKQVWLSV